MRVTRETARAWRAPALRIRPHEAQWDVGCGTCSSSGPRGPAPPLEAGGALWALPGRVPGTCRASCADDAGLLTRPRRPGSGARDEAPRAAPRRPGPARVAASVPRSRRESSRVLTDVLASSVLKCVTRVDRRGKQQEKSEVRVVVMWRGPRNVLLLRRKRRPRAAWGAAPPAQTRARLFRPLEDTGRQEQEPPGVTAGPGPGSRVGVGGGRAVCRFAASEDRSLACGRHSAAGRQRTQPRRAHSLQPAAGDLCRGRRRPGRSRVSSGGPLAGRGGSAMGSSLLGRGSRAGAPRASPEVAASVQESVTVTDFPAAAGPHACLFSLAAVRPVRWTASLTTSRSRQAPGRRRTGTSPTW